MPASFRTCLPLVMLVLAACSPQPDKAVTTPAADSPMAKAKAEFSRLQAQGPDATAREITKLEYALTRNLMKAGGLDAALGGEAKAETQSARSGTETSGARRNRKSRGRE